MRPERIENYIGGRLTGPLGDRWLDNIDPSTGSVYGQIPDSDASDVRNAVDAAAAAFPDWSSAPAAERSAILTRIGDLIEANLDDLAHAESVDNGKPLWLARKVDIPRAAKNFRFFATAILHGSSQMHRTDEPNNEALNYTLRQPLGVVGCISPWNLPLYLFSWKIAPALAAGNTVVAKPSEVTPVTAGLLSDLCIEAGMPAGVLNIVHGLGPGVGQAIVEHPEVKAISFTGGTATGAAIARTAAPMFKKLSLELGGKNPNIIFDDADLDAAFGTSVASSFANQGQICLCGSRVFAHRSIYDKCVAHLVSAAKAMSVGDPLDPATRQGALVSAEHRAKVEAAIQLARDEGGTVECGGVRPSDLPERCAGGYFLEPTVITGLGPSCATNQEEIFGPVISVMPFDSDDEVIVAANSTRYGLSATVWTRDLNRAHRVAERLQAGTVWINCWLLRDLRVPFGGMKDSGVGREGGDEALRFFTEPKNVCIRLSTGGSW